MDLTLATPIRFKINKSENQAAFKTKVSPKKRRTVNKIVFEDGSRKKKAYTKDFFKPTTTKGIGKNKDTEMVSGTTWEVQYKMGTNYQVLHQDLTTKEIKAFILSNGTTARATTAINWIDSTLALEETHADKFAIYTALDYNILELMTRINKTAIFDDTDIGITAKHYIDVLYADQNANNAAHTARVAFVENFDLSTDSKTWLAARGINIR
nr:hypothetical protein [uncultured Mediterranean phage uvMED]